MAACQYPFGTIVTSSVMGFFPRQMTNVYPYDLFSQYCIVSAYKLGSFPLFFILRISSSHFRSRKCTPMSPTFVGTVHSLSRRHSWPSLQADRSAKVFDTIDRDPFPYFVSPITDEEDTMDSDLTAGIISRRRSLSVPVFRTTRSNKPILSNTVVKHVERLKKWIKKMETSHFHSRPPISVSSAPPPQAPISLDELPTVQRGRDIHMTATSRVRNKIRSPPRKPRAWRRPSDNIWPVLEESESSSTVGLGIKT